MSEISYIECGFLPEGDRIDYSPDIFKMREFDNSLLEDLCYRCKFESQGDLKRFLTEVKDFRKLQGLPYLVSDCGRVISLFGKGNEIIGSDVNGYKILGINYFGKFISYGVHRLVMMAFYGEHKGFCVNHINGNPSDNHLYNLEFVSAKENSHHATNFGLSNVAAQLTSKLKRSQVEQIFLLHDSGYLLIEIANQMGISSGQVSKIISKRHNKNILYRYNV